MYKLNEIAENGIISLLTAGFDRSPCQLNRLHESDAEIINLGGMKLAVTTDSISEEIKTGLYDDPYFVGWMIVTVNMSDLAAAGASPIGILISEIIPGDFKPEKLQQLQRGISDACRKYKTFVLGGDTNEGENLILTGTAVGIIENENHISRLGCKPGDFLFSSGKIGCGNAYAISKLIKGDNFFNNYNPAARTTEGLIISKYASCCMDTSDGLLSALDQLMRLNDAGFEIETDLQKIIELNAFNYSAGLNIPPWLLLAGQHGEFELVFTVPEKLKKSFLEEASKNRFEPVELGRVTAETGIKIPVYGKIVQIDTKFLRNLLYETKGDVKLYLKMLLEYDNQLRNESDLNFT